MITSRPRVIILAKSISSLITEPHDEPDFSYKWACKGIITHTLYTALEEKETCFIMTMKTLLLASALFAGLFDSLAAVPITPAPYHAYCRTLWLFATPCADIGSTIVQQIQAFNPLLVSANPGFIKANHNSIDGLQAESISFTFTPTVMTGGCRVSAFSISLGFTSRLDDGVNYCNLYNVLSASGLTSSPGFMELTNEWACLSYGLATCNDN
ncbi:hypothetical protein F2P81_000457 [Scophthalmus maximus]|uniref:Uncharacterized protein n=1 Tax=Scophthalmus maximus TaxID=52904 RepID=A0A6A4TUD8_SCOMX|nr:hypothetical protein F2P81_000457 [Scophthalmus maximus]